MFASVTGKNTAFVFPTNFSGSRQGSAVFEMLTLLIPVGDLSDLVLDYMKNVGASWWIRMKACMVEILCSGILRTD